jgi:hypothetical protein
MDEFKRLLTECLQVLNMVSNQPYVYLNENRRSYGLASEIQKTLEQSINGIEYKCSECDFIFGGDNAYYRACNCDHHGNNELSGVDSREKAKALWGLFGDIPIDNMDCIESPFENFPVGTDRFEIFHWFEETFNLSVAKDLMKLS